MPKNTECLECYQFLNTKILFDKQPSGTEFDIFMKFMFKRVYIHAVKRIVFLHNNMNAKYNRNRRCCFSL